MPRFPPRLARRPPSTHGSRCHDQPPSRSQNGEGEIDRLGHLSSSPASPRSAFHVLRQAGHARRTVRTGKIRIVAVADGPQTGEVIADLAGSTLGRCLAVSDRHIVRDHVAAGAAVTDLNWLLTQVQPG